MTIFTKNPKSPEMVEKFRQNKETLVEVTVKQLYLLTYNPEFGRSLEEIMEDWFKTFKGRSHCYRDGSRIGGCEEVVEIKVLTEGGRTVSI